MRLWAVQRPAEGRWGGKYFLIVTAENMQTEMWTPGEQRQTECATYLFTCITVNEIWHQGLGPMHWQSNADTQTHTRTHQTRDDYTKMHMEKHAVQTINKHNSLMILRIKCNLKTFLPKPKSTARLRQTRKSENIPQTEWYFNFKSSQQKVWLKILNNLILTMFPILS